MATANVTKVDYYEVLSVSRDASDPGAEDGLSQAGDAVSSGPQSERSEAEEKFKECSEAYRC